MSASNTNTPAKSAYALYKEAILNNGETVESLHILIAQTKEHLYAATLRNEATPNVHDEREIRFYTLLLSTCEGRLEIHAEATEHFVKLKQTLAESKKQRAAKALAKRHNYGETVKRQSVFTDTSNDPNPLEAAKASTMDMFKADLKGHFGEFETAYYRDRASATEAVLREVFKCSNDDILNAIAEARNNKQNP